MFSRNQPREVYRVYGEDDFFAEEQDNAQDYRTQDHEDYPHPQSDPPVPEPPAQFQEQPQPVQQFVPPARFEEQPQPVQQFVPPARFEEQPQPVQHFAPPPISQPVEYAPPTQSYEQPVAAVFAGEHHGAQPHQPQDMLAASTGGVYGTGTARRRTGGLIILAGVIGLLLGLLLISSLRGAGASNRPSASAPPAQTTAQVRTTALGQRSHSAAQPSGVPAVHHQIHRRAHITIVHAPSRHPSHARSALPAPVHPSTYSSRPVRLGAPEHFGSPAPVSVPAPVSAPAPSYAPPSSAQTGSEFGFEN